MQMVRVVVYFHFSNPNPLQPYQYTINNYYKHNLPEYDARFIIMHNLICYG